MARYLANKNAIFLLQKFRSALNRTSQHLEFLNFSLGCQPGPALEKRGGKAGKKGKGYEWRANEGRRGGNLLVG